MKTESEQWVRPSPSLFSEFASPSVFHAVRTGTRPPPLKAIWEKNFPGISHRSPFLRTHWKKTPEENSQISRENLPNVWRNLQNFRVLG